jgi:hypothetical protein
MSRALWVAAILAAASACTDQPFSRHVRAGSSITLTLTQFVEGTTIGFGSTLGGPDAQRGSLSFVLCVQNMMPDQSLVVSGIE